MMNDSHARTAKAVGVAARIKKLLVQNFDAAFVAGSLHKEYFTSLGLDSEKIVTGYDAVDNEYFMQAAIRVRSTEAALRAKHGLPVRYFLNVGRMEWKKNLEVLIDAYQLAREEIGENCPRLVFIGSGKLEQSLHERCRIRGFSIWQAESISGNVSQEEANVLFYGFRQVDELPEFYTLATAFVLPSREEEWGLVVNEAMACGLPVLVSKVAGCAEDLVRHGENGFVFDPFDAAELAGYLTKIAHEPVLGKSMGLASQAIIADWGCERFAKGAQQAAQIALN